LTLVDEDVMVGKFWVSLSSVFSRTLTNLFPRANNDIAVAGVDLTKKIEVDVHGEILELKDTVNEMTESLSVLADEVLRVAKVRTEGRLGGQARVTNVGGTWKDLTGGVNVVLT
jgi:methyl-accepting chemotaxis protein